MSTLPDYPPGYPINGHVELAETSVDLMRESSPASNGYFVDNHFVISKYDTSDTEYLGQMKI